MALAPGDGYCSRGVGSFVPSLFPLVADDYGAFPLATVVGGKQFLDRILW